MMRTYWIYAIEGYEKYDKTTQLYHEVKKIDVIAKTEVEALQQAKKMLKCNHYMVRGVFERYYDAHTN